MFNSLNLIGLVFVVLQDKMTRTKNKCVFFRSHLCVGQVHASFFYVNLCVDLFVDQANTKFDVNFYFVCRPNRCIGAFIHLHQFGQTISQQ